MKGKFLTYEERKEICKEDAYQWFITGHNYEGLKESDIIAGYPDGYFTDEKTDEHDKAQLFYTPDYIAMLTIVELYASITWHKGEPYFITEPILYSHRDLLGYTWYCASAVTRNNEPCIVWWVALNGGEFEDAFDWADAHRITLR